MVIINKRAVLVVIIKNRAVLVVIFKNRAVLAVIITINSHLITGQGHQQDPQQTGEQDDAE